jgi:hypothetical protein
MGIEWCCASGWTRLSVLRLGRERERESRIWNNLRLDFMAFDALDAGWYWQKT